MLFRIKSFHQLTLMELFRLYELRSRVFVVEQNCAYQDPDEKDLQAIHVLMVQEEELIAYARLLPPAISYPEPSIGRVVVEPHYRKKNLGRQLMQYCLMEMTRLYPQQHIVISAQLYLLEFYSSLGFIAEGQSYLEDNIPHIRMRYLPPGGKV